MKEVGQPRAICITSPYPPSKIGGIGRFVSELSRAIQSMGIRVEVLSPRSGASAAERYDSIPLRWSIFRNAELAAKTGWLVLRRARRVDALHAQQPHLQSAVVLAIGRVLGVRGVLTLHLRVPRPKGRFRRLLLSTGEWLSIRMASKVVAVSRSVAEDFGDSRIQVVENGVDTDRFAPDPERRSALRDSLGLGVSPTFVFAGRWSRTKGLDLLLDAATGASLRATDFRLLILGEPATDEPDVLEAVRKTGSDARVKIIGRVREEMLPEYLCAADAFVLPSVIEGLPLAALEALSCGVPLLVSDIRALQDLVRGTGAAWTFRSGDVRDLERALSEIISQGPRPDLRQRARDAAVRRFSLETMAGRYVDVYRESRRRSEGFPSSLESIVP